MSDRLTPVPDHNDEAFESTLTEQPLSAGQPTPNPEAPAKRQTPRSTRILLGALLLALAAFIWFNYVWQPAAPQPLAQNGQQGGGNASGGTPQPVTVDRDAPARGTPAALATPAAIDDSAAPDTMADGTISVAELPRPGVVPGDLEIVELPFLVSQPPAAAEEETAEAETEDPGAPERPAAVRVSVNPFSPVVLHTPDVTAASEPAPAAPAPEPVATGPEQIINVSIPDGPDQNAITTIAPPPGTTAGSSAGTPAGSSSAAAAAPQAVTPPAVVPSTPEPVALTQNLPRPLPGPSLSTVPDLLQERRVIETIPSPNLVQVAAVEEPDAELDVTVTERVSDTDADTPGVLPPVAARVMPSDADPLVAGITPLSRYLRDYDVTFTGMVLGPVGQGVFRSSTSPRPVVVGIGQQLPETDITLTDLRGQQAEFTLADSSQFLTLDLRR